MQQQQHQQQMGAHHFFPQQYQAQPAAAAAAPEVEQEEEAPVQQYRGVSRHRWAGGRRDAGARHHTCVASFAAASVLLFAHHLSAFST